jgi:PAS domain S-box-containing protein
MYTVLYVDDEPGLLEIGKLFLEENGQFSVDITTSAPEALARMNAKTYDAIISDYQMPVMDGIEFLKKVRTSGNTIPFILFTGRGREEVVIQALNEGADFYLQKGGDPTSQFIELSNKIQYAVTRRHAEESLKQNEAQFRQIIDLVPHMIFANDWDGNFILVNQAVARSYDRKVEEVEGNSQARFHRVTEELHHMFADNREVITTGKTKFIPKETYTDRFGKKRYLQTTKVPFTTLGNNQQAVLGVAIDITERIQAEEALRESEEKYRLVVENSKDAIYIHQYDKLLFVNNRASVLTGYSHEELMQIRLWDLVHPDDRDKLLGNNRKRLAGGEVPTEFIARLLTKDGTSRICEFIVDLVTYRGDPAILGIARDITERRKTEEALASANTKLKLLSGITRHDIRNQLTILEGHLAFIKKNQPGHPFRDHFDKMTKAARDISSIIQFTKEYEDIGIHAPLWQDCRTLVDTAAKQVSLGQIAVKNDLPPGTEVFADPLIVKVFYNLMDNAARYGDKIISVRFSLDGSGEDYRIVCEDDGEGIPAEDKKNIFRQGFGRNTGLGLFLSAAILNITGITIRETGEPGKGARFEIIVPKGAYRFVGEA